MKQSNKIIKFETYIPVTQPMFQTKYLDKNLFFKGLQMMDDTPRQMRVMSPVRLKYCNYNDKHVRELIQK